MRALFIDSDGAFAFWVAEALKSQKRFLFELEWAANLATGLERLKQPGVDVVLLDLALPECPGLEAFRQVHTCAMNTPVIVMTDYNNSDLAMEALRAGAQDFIGKENLQEQGLVHAIRYAMLRSTLLFALQREVRRLALTEAMQADRKLIEGGTEHEAENDTGPV